MMYYVEKCAGRAPAPLRGLVRIRQDFTINLNDTILKIRG